ncbi:MAG TPA: PRC-barrel domain-containing protein [Actinomycetota bacterium]|nr:PRC-barrel domain-containing protein [Actinomycetota bacterium]
MTPDETPIAWLALEPGAPVFTSDGEEVGRVTTVVADRQKDIFSGVRVRLGLFDRERFVPADLIERLTTDGAHLRLASDDVDDRLGPADA